MFKRRKKQEQVSESEEATLLLDRASLAFLLYSTTKQKPDRKYQWDTLDELSADFGALLSSLADSEGDPAVRDLLDRSRQRATIGYQAEVWKKDIRRAYGRRADWRAPLADYDAWVSEGVWPGAAR